LKDVLRVDSRTSAEERYSALCGMAQKRRANVWPFIVRSIYTSRGDYVRRVAPLGCSAVAYTRTNHGTILALHCSTVAVSGVRRHALLIKRAAMLHRCRDVSGECNLVGIHARLVRAYKRDQRYNSQTCTALYRCAGAICQVVTVWF
jgi:hypothetical protein